MGSSEKAGNKGKPATPRDGSAVELVGLLKCVVSWLAKLNRENRYPYSGVERKHKNGNITQWTFQEWSEKIQANFEKYFWVNLQPINGELRPDLINKRGIYKDSYGSSYEYTDFQLRCNFPIAMVAVSYFLSHCQISKKNIPMNRNIFNKRKIKSTFNIHSFKITIPYLENHLVSTNFSSMQ